MIGREYIEELLEKILDDERYFVVGISVSRGNKIRVLVDHEQGINVEQCAEINRRLNLMLDRGVEDYSLEVSSPGTDTPLILLTQYRKNIGRGLEILLKGGSKISGRLKRVDDEAVVLESEGSDNKDERISFENIEKATVKIVFK